MSKRKWDRIDVQCSAEGRAIHRSNRVRRPNSRQAAKIARPKLISVEEYMKELLL